MITPTPQRSDPATGIAFDAIEQLAEAAAANVRTQSPRVTVTQLTAALEAARSLVKSEPVECAPLHWYALVRASSKMVSHAFLGESKRTMCGTDSRETGTWLNVGRDARRCKHCARMTGAR